MLQSQGHTHTIRKDTLIFLIHLSLEYLSQLFFCSTGCQGRSSSLEHLRCRSIEFRPPAWSEVLTAPPVTDQRIWVGHPFTFLFAIQY